MNERTIPTRNYIILLVVALVTFIILFFFVSYYEKRKEYQNSKNTRMSFLSDIKESELPNYILDNSDTIIYVSDSTDSNYETFESELNTLIL